MNDSRQTLSNLSVFAVALSLLSSCAEHNEYYYTDQTCPIQSISVTVQGEEVAGTVEGHTVSLFYESADDFTAASIDLSVTDGYTLTFPEDLSVVDLTSDAVLIFKTPEGQVKKYFFDLGYAKSMIIDPSKIRVSGSDAVPRVSDISGTIVLSLDPATMAQSSIQLEFPKGSLIEGAKASRSVFDFTEGLVQTFYIYKGSVRKKFTITLDVSALMSDYRRYDLTDVTTNFVTPEDAEHMKVWTGKIVKGVPVRNMIKDGDLKLKSNYVAETPFVSNYGTDYTDPRIFGAIGDWEDSRLTEDITGIDIGIVVMDSDWVKADLVTGSARSITISNAGGFVAISGMPASYSEIVWNDGKKKTEEMLEFESGTFKLDNRNFYRPAVLIDESGSLSVVNVVRSKADKVWYKWQKTSTPEKLSFDYIYRNSVEIKNFKDLATSAPLCILNGHKMMGKEVLYGSSEQWEPAFGQAWNGARMKAYVGRTYDNKIGIAVFNMGVDSEREAGDTRPQREAVIGTYQGAWLLGKLGWRDVLPIATAFYLEENFAPTIIVNGKVLSGDAGQKSAYAIKFDKK